MRFLLRLLLNGAAIFLAASVIDGIQLDGPTPALLAGILLGVINATIRPVLKILTFPITILTLGLFTLVINAVCFALTAYAIDGFSISGAVPAFLGALLVSVVSWLLSLALVPSNKKS
jgi:putative membrane protein